MTQPATNTAYWSKFWGVSPRAIQLWRKQDVPFTNPSLMAMRALTQKDTARGVRAKLAELGLHSGFASRLHGSASVPASTSTDSDGKPVDIDWLAYQALTTRKQPEDWRNEMSASGYSDSQIAQAARIAVEHLKHKARYPATQT